MAKYTFEARGRIQIHGEVEADTEEDALALAKREAIMEMDVIDEIGVEPDTEDRE